MHTVTVTREVAAPFDDVWNALDDFGNVYRYNPNVESSHATNDTERGLGATRECRLYGGNVIQEEVVAYEDEHLIRVEITDPGRFPLKSNTVDIAVHEVDDDTARVTMALTYEPKYGPVGWVMAKAMMNTRFEATFEGVLGGLERHLQTGREVGEDGVLLDASSTAGGDADGDAAAA